MTKITAFFLLILTVSACKSEKERAILGKWNAAKLTECDEIIPIANTLVNIEFKSNGGYIFNSTLDVHEEGTYKIKKNYLYTLDKLRDKATEKIVLIKQITADTLVLEMNYKGKEQWLTLIKDTVEGDKTADETKEVKTPTSSNKVPASQPAAKEALARTENSSENASKPEEAQPKAEKVAEKVAEEDNSKSLTAMEAYKLREEKRKAADAEIKRKEKEIRDAYLEREAQRKKNEAERKRKK